MTAAMDSVKLKRAADTIEQAIKDAMAALDVQIFSETPSDLVKLLNDYCSLQAALSHMQTGEELGQEHKQILVKYMREQLIKKRKHDQVHHAEKNLTAKLNYGGIFADGPQYGTRLRLHYRSDDTKTEVEGLKNLARSAMQLAVALELAEAPLVTNRSSRHIENVTKQK